MMAVLVDIATWMLLLFIQPRIMRRVNLKHPPAKFKEGKFLIFIGGGNGSGKTAINNLVSQKMEKEGYDWDYVAKFGSHIFEDLLSRRFLRRIRILLENFLHRAAAETEETPRKRSFLRHVVLSAFLKAQSRAIAVGAPIIIDYHMHNRVFVRLSVENARKNGYECIMLSPHVDAETILPRLENRYNRTGRPFKLQDILIRHKQFAANLDSYLELFDLSVIMDNNGENTPPSIIAISHEGNTTVYNEEAYANVRRKIELNSAAKTADDLWKNSQNAAGVDLKPDQGRVGSGDKTYERARKEESGNGRFVKMIEDDLKETLAPKTPSTLQKIYRSFSLK